MTSFEHLLPSDSFDVFSSTLNDSDVCLSYRQRGYRVYVFNISLDHIVRWKWYLENQSRAFIQRSYGQGEHFHSVIRDYVRLLLLHRYGGTFLSLDTVILRPLPNTEFIESDGNGTCCALNTTGLYQASDLMHFRPRRLFLWEIFEQSFKNRSDVDGVGSIRDSDTGKRHDRLSYRPSFGVR